MQFSMWSVDRYCVLYTHTNTSQVVLFLYLSALFIKGHALQDHMQLLVSVRGGWGKQWETLPFVLKYFPDYGHAALSASARQSGVQHPLLFSPCHWSPCKRSQQHHQLIFTLWLGMSFSHHWLPPRPPAISSAKLYPVICMSFSHHWSLQTPPAISSANFSPVAQHDLLTPLINANTTSNIIS